MRSSAGRPRTAFPWTISAERPIVKLPDTKDLAVALHLVGEAQELLARANSKFPDVLPGLLRELADRLEKSEPETVGPEVSHG